MINKDDKNKIKKSINSLHSSVNSNYNKGLVYQLSKLRETNNLKDENNNNYVKNTNSKFKNKSINEGSYKFKKATDKYNSSFKNKSVRVDYNDKDLYNNKKNKNNTDRKSDNPYFINNKQDELRNTRIGKDKKKEREKKENKDKIEKKNIREKKEEKERKEKEEKEKKEKEERKKRKEKKEKEENEKKEKEEKERKEKEEKERKEKEEKEKKEKEEKEKKEKEEKERKEKEEKERKEKEKKEKEEKEKKEKEEKEKKEKKEKEKNINSTEISSSSSSVDSQVFKVITSKIGLRNLGNTCFMNTCLQNLIHTEYFIQQLFLKKHLISSKTPISQKFYEICSDLISYNGSAYSPNQFKLEFGINHSMFSGYGQHDTQEFCRILLEDMNKELNEVKNPPPYKEMPTYKKSKIECDKNFDKIFRERENSLIMDVFYGQLINIFKCKCDLETFSFEKILDLPLLLPKDATRTIEQLLDEYFIEEEIQFETKCEECGKKTVHKKQVKITQPPNVLILSLQRRNERTGRKNDCIVEFPDELDISKYIENDFYNKNGKYTLYGIGNHSGSMNFGHYYAFIKLNNGNWFEYNDSSVTSHSMSRRCSSSSAYVLFYKRN